jgi:Protein of unknown function (DUF3592)
MRKARSKTMMYLFFMPFFIIGLFLLALSAYQVIQHYRAQTWQPVQATVLDQSVAHELNAQGRAAIGGTSRTTGHYSYEWQGRRYQSDQLSFFYAKTRQWGASADQWDAKLQAMMQDPSGKVTVWVNPHQPAQAVMLRDIRWLELGAMVIFGLLLVCSSGLFLWGGDPQTAQAKFSWMTVGAMAVTGVLLTPLSLLLWRDSHAVWAVVAMLPLLLALVGIYNGLFRS